MNRYQPFKNDHFDPSYLKTTETETLTLSNHHLIHRYIVEKFQLSSKLWENQILNDKIVTQRARAVRKLRKLLYSSYIVRTLS